MKKIASILLITLILLLAACGGEAIHDGSSPNVALLIANRGDKGFNDSAVIGLNVSVVERSEILFGSFFDFRALGDESPQKLA
jgi:basic membrane lipoprotein Med (substrate-binding protein (PBP1-ABC) superfamily)